jgi:pyrrolysine biosynthesis protein PylC
VVLKIAVMGGGLQGVETAYLAAKAGWHVTVVDRRAQPPARELAHVFRQADLVDAVSVAASVPRDSDVVFPALENPRALAALTRWARHAPMPLVFDPSAYWRSASKLVSNRLMARLGLPLPQDWPGCGLPVVVKPSRGSGSAGVRVCRTFDRLPPELARGRTPRGWVCQAFVPGRTFSLEVIGDGKRYQPLQVTDLFMDAAYDCKRVAAPTRLPEPLVRRLEGFAVTMAGALKLRGLMDVEVVRHGDRLEVLEIDARIPSQTPTAVYWSSGVNMIRRLGMGALGQSSPADEVAAPRRAVVYEHIRVSPAGLIGAGEHMLAQAGPLDLVSGFFGADEALTDFRPGRPDWVATLIVSGADRREAWQRRRAVLAAIRQRLNLPGHSNSTPVRIGRHQTL